jgi:hypothetical protein
MTDKVMIVESTAERQQYPLVTNCPHNSSCVQIICVCIITLPVRDVQSAETAKTLPVLGLARLRRSTHPLYGLPSQCALSCRQSALSCPVSHQLPPSTPYRCAEHLKHSLLLHVLRSAPAMFSLTQAGCLHAVRTFISL